MRPFFINFKKLFKCNKLLYCHGLGSAKNDAQLIQEWTEKNSIQFQMIKYKGYIRVSEVEQIWNIENWDITEELQKDQQNKFITVCVSAGAQAFLRAVLNSPILLNRIEGLLLISPGVGMEVDNYINRVFPLRAKELLKSGSCVEHPKENESSEDVLINLKSLEDYAQNCVLKRSFPAFNFPVRIVHGVHDKIVPFPNSLELLNKINSNDKTIIQVNSGHLIKEYSIIIRAMDSLLEAVEKNRIPFYYNIPLLNLAK